MFYTPLPLTEEKKFILINKMSEKRKETIQREGSPIINVCDTTTAIAVTSENIDLNEDSTDHVRLPRTHNFHLSVPYLHQSAAKNTNLSTTMARSDNLITEKSVDHPLALEANTKSRTKNNLGKSFKATSFHGHIQTYHEELRSVYTRDRSHNTGDHSKHDKSRRQSRTELPNFSHSLTYEHGSSSDDDEPDRKFRRCLEGERHVTQDGCETPTASVLGTCDIMTTNRSKVPEEVRLRINSRERQRMHDLNSALDSLRQVGLCLTSGETVVREGNLKF